MKKIFDWLDMHELAETLITGTIGIIIWCLLVKLQFNMFPSRGPNDYSKPSALEVISYIILIAHPLVSFVIVIPNENRLWMIDEPIRFFVKILFGSWSAVIVVYIFLMFSLAWSAISSVSASIGSASVKGGGLSIESKKSIERHSRMASNARKTGRTEDAIDCEMRVMQDFIEADPVLKSDTKLQRDILLMSIAEKSNDKIDIENTRMTVQNDIINDMNSAERK